MTRRSHRKQSSSIPSRPRKRGRSAAYPLPRSLGALSPVRARRAHMRFIKRSPPIGETDARARRYPRGVRLSGWFIVLILPVMTVAWALSLAIPVAIETREAVGKVFVEPVEREHFDQAAGPVDLTPEPIPTQAPLPTATLAPTPKPGEPTHTPAPPTPTPYPAWDGDDPINILLLGVDSREGEDGPPRSDTIIVVRVDPGAKRIDMLSVPRDLLVEIPGYYATKINAAYPFGETDEDIPGGGPTLAAQTVELNFGIRIDYFAEVDIAGMERIVDTLGGIILDVPGIVKDEQYPTENYGYTRVYFSPGLQMMDGTTAVRYSRTRHDDGDFARQSRQQQVLLAMRERALATGLIGKLPELISEVGDSVRTDLSVRQALSLARLAQDVGEERIYTHSLSDLVREETINEGFYFVGDWDAIQELAADLPGDPNGQNTLAPGDDPTEGQGE
jgi:LCP family protein required for cell wall assembly